MEKKRKEIIMILFHKPKKIQIKLEKSEKNNEGPYVYDIRDSDIPQKFTHPCSIKRV